MIPIAKGAAPAAAVALEQQEVQRIGAALAASESLSRDLIGSGYQQWKTALRNLQLGKCCYCEWRYVHAFNDVEHFRPALSAQRGANFPSTVGYWWLAYRWDNLYFACASCNRSGKNDEFPLEVGSVPLAPLALPPGQERPLLIDPVEDPLQHITYGPLVEANKTRWRPFGKTKRGKETIRVLKLDADVLLEEYEHHVNGPLAGALDGLLHALRSGDLAAINSAWQLLCRWLDPHHSFTMLTHDVIRYRFGPQLPHWGLDPTGELKRRWSSKMSLPYP